jgi:hypothetical protein
MNAIIVDMDNATLLPLKRQLTAGLKGILKVVLTYFFQLVKKVVSFQFNCKNNPKILCTPI